MPLTDAEKWERGLYQIRLLLTAQDAYYEMVKRLAAQEWSQIVNLYHIMDPVDKLGQFDELPFPRFLPQMDACYTWYNATKLGNHLVIRGSVDVVRKLTWMVPIVMFSTNNKGGVERSELVSIIQRTVSDAIDNRVTHEL